MNRKIEPNPTSSKNAVRKTILRNVEVVVNNPKVNVLKQPRRTVSDFRNLHFEESTAQEDNDDVFRKPHLQTTLKIAKEITKAKNLQPKMRYRSTGDLTPKTKKVFKEVVSL